MATGTKITLQQAEGATPEERRKTFLIGCASLHFANLLGQTATIPKDRPNVIEFRRSATPLLNNGPGKSSHYHHHHQQRKNYLAEAYARKYRRAVARKVPVVLCMISLWLFIMMLLMSPLYFFMFCYNKPQTTASTQLVSIAEITGTDINNSSNNATPQWLLSTDVLISTVLSTYRLETPPAPPCVCEGKGEGKGGQRSRRDLLQTLRSTYERAKSEAMSRATQMEGVYKKGVEQLTGRKTRSVGGKLMPGGYLMFRLTRDVGAERKKEEGNGSVEKANELGSEKGDARERNAEEKVKIEGGTVGNEDEQNRVDSEAAFRRIVSEDKIEVVSQTEEKMDATAPQPGVKVVPTAPMEGKENEIKDEADKKCKDDENVEKGEIKKASALGDNMEPAMPEQGSVGVEGNKEKKSELVENLVKAGVGTGEGLPTGGPEAVDPGSSKPVTAIPDIGAKEGTKKN